MHIGHDSHHDSQEVADTIMRDTRAHSKVTMHAALTYIMSYTAKAGTMLRAASNITLTKFTPSQRPASYYTHYVQIDAFARGSGEIHDQKNVNRRRPPGRNSRRHCRFKPR